MKYVVVLAGEAIEVAIEALGATDYRLQLGERCLEVQATATGELKGGWDAALALLVGGRAVRVDLEAPAAHGATPRLLIDGCAVAPQVFSARAYQAQAQQAKSGPGVEGAQVAAPMAGKVVSVLVNEGDEVQAGQGLLVVEAMKMENELRAPQAGTVRNLAAAVGGAVRSGAVVCTVS